MHAWLAGLHIDDTQDGDGPLDVSHLYMAKPSPDEYGCDVIDALIEASIGKQNAGSRQHRRSSAAALSLAAALHRAGAVAPLQYNGR